MFLLEEGSCTMGEPTAHLEDFTIERYICEDLDATERQALETHLQACPSCTQRLQEQRDAAQAKRAADEAPG